MSLILKSITKSYHFDWGGIKKTDSVTLWHSKKKLKKQPHQYNMLHKFKHVSTYTTVCMCSLYIPGSPAYQVLRFHSMSLMRIIYCSFWFILLYPRLPLNSQWPSCLSFPGTISQTDISHAIQLLLGFLSFPWQIQFQIFSFSVFQILRILRNMYQVVWAACQSVDFRPLFYFCWVGISWGKSWKSLVFKAS